MRCPDHDELSIAVCETCGREVCEICLEEAESPEEFECPECGEYGVALFDDDYGDLTGEEEEEEAGLDL